MQLWAQPCVAVTLEGRCLRLREAQRVMLWSCLTAKELAQHPHWEAKALHGAVAPSASWVCALDHQLPLFALTHYFLMFSSYQCPKLKSTLSASSCWHVRASELHVGDILTPVRWITSSSVGSETPPPSGSLNLLDKLRSMRWSRKKQACFSLAHMLEIHSFTTH